MLHEIHKNFTLLFSFNKNIYTCHYTSKILKYACWMYYQDCTGKKCSEFFLNIFLLIRTVDTTISFTSTCEHIYNIYIYNLSFDLDCYTRKLKIMNGVRFFHYVYIISIIYIWIYWRKNYWKKKVQKKFRLSSSIYIYILFIM